MRAFRICVGLATAAALAAILTGCPRDRAESKQAPRSLPVPVAVASVEEKAVPVQVQAIGTVEAYSVVSVKAQVGGELVRVHFKEGQDVRKGDLLFTIDPRPFEAALAQAQATLAKDVGQIQQARAALDRDRAKVSQTQAALARDQAQAKNADVEARRYAELLRRELISQEQADQFRTTAESLAHTLLADEADIKSAEETVRADQAAVKSAEQTVRADEAAVDNAKIQLGYTVIRSPIDGRTGSLMLHEGNVVRASGTNDSTLVVINQIQPIYVSFTVPQQQLPVIKRYMGDGKLEVRALPPGEPEPLRGVVTFIDNAVDQTTGTIRLKATFANEERRLWRLHRGPESRGWRRCVTAGRRSGRQHRRRPEAAQSSRTGPPRSFRDSFRARRRRSISATIRGTTSSRGLRSTAPSRSTTVKGSPSPSRYFWRRVAGSVSVPRPRTWIVIV